MIAAEQLTVRFGDRVALDDVSLQVNDGELVGIVGVAAAGKSTLLKTLCLLVRPDTGRLILDGTELTALSAGDLASVRSRFGFSFQNLAIFDQLSAAENVSFALVRRGVAHDDALVRAKAQLKAVGLEAAAEKLPHQLSGGMRRRLALARAMVARPEVGLYDDPFVGLDPVACARIARFIAREHREVGGVTIVAAGDPSPLFAVATRMVLLDQGRVVADLPTEAFARAELQAVAAYLGRESAA